MFTGSHQLRFEKLIADDNNVQQVSTPKIPWYHQGATIGLQCNLQGHQVGVVFDPYEEYHVGVVFDQVGVVFVQI